MTPKPTDQPKVPALRFPEFSGEWEETWLGEVADSKYGMNAAAKPFDGKHRYLRITDIDERTRTLSASSIVSPDADDFSDYRVRKGDLLFARTGASTGMSYLCRSDQGELYFAGFLIRFAFRAMEPSFVFYQTLTSRFDHWVSYMSVRSGQPGINANEYAQYRLWTAQLAEQQKIADFLGAVDARLDGLRKKWDLLADYKRGAMQKIFSQQIRFTRDDGSAFPDWEFVHLSKAFEERVERNCSSLPLLSLSIKSGIGLADKRNGKVVHRPDDLSNYKRVAVGDFAYNTMRMWQGASALSHLEGIVSPAYTVMTPKDGQVATFWSFALKYRPLVFLFQRYSQGLTSDTWSLKFPAFSEVKFSVPHPDEQKKIADFLTALDAKIGAVDAQITETQAFKKGLLQQMFV